MKKPLQISFIILFFLLFWSCSDNITESIVENKSNFEWAQYGPNGQGLSIALDKKGNIYVVGYYSLRVSLDSIVITDNYFSKFLAKYSSSGSLLWAIPGNFSAVATDEQNNIYISGKLLKNSKIAGNKTLVQDADIVKLNENDDVTWGIKLPSLVYKISFDKQGNIYAMSDVIYKVSPGGEILFKIDLTGKNIWLRQMVAGQSGEIYITGRILNGTTMFGNIALTTTSNKDLFIAKFNSNGNCEWAKNYGYGNNKYDSGGAGLDIDNEGNIYLLGYFETEYTIEGVPFTAQNYSSFFIISYDKYGGMRWVKNIKAQLTTNGTLKIGKDQSIYIAGGYYNTIDLKPISYTPNSNALFVGKLDLLGNGIWIENTSAVSPPMLQDMSFDLSGNIFITGNFQLGITFGSSTITNPSGGMFVVKLKVH